MVSRVMLVKICSLARRLCTWNIQNQDIDLLYPGPRECGEIVVHISDRGSVSMRHLPAGTYAYSLLLHDGRSRIKGTACIAECIIAVAHSYSVDFTDRLLQVPA